MRRKRQQLSEAESINILEKATSGTLALLGDGGYPYAVPISYVYADGKLYFHSALWSQGGCPQSVRQGFVLRHRAGLCSTKGVHHLFPQRDSLRSGAYH